MNVHHRGCVRSLWTDFCALALRRNRPTWVRGVAVSRLLRMQKAPGSTPGESIFLLAYADVLVELSVCLIQPVRVPQRCRVWSYAIPNLEVLVSITTGHPSAIV